MHGCSQHVWPVQAQRSLQHAHAASARRRSQVRQYLRTFLRGVRLYSVGYQRAHSSATLVTSTMR